jgi:hypothetical protein
MENFLSLTDQEIYALAHNVLTDITEKLADGTYKNLNGHLAFAWSTEKKFNAWAESRTLGDGPPQHKIVLHYELARILYRDAEAFCSFAVDEQTKNLITRSFGNNATEALPSCFTINDCIHNMFLASLTWVYFHELGHLMQEHGRVRNCGTVSKTSTIAEFDAHAANALEGRQAAISHATELAADFEATTQCLVASVQHFLKGPLVDESDGAEVFLGNVYLLTCSLSCIFYRFNAGSPARADFPVTGSHPNPIYRLEIAAPHIYEFTEVLLRANEFDANKRHLVSMVKQAADLGSFFYNYTRATGTEETIHLFIKGLPQRPEFRSYSQEILNTWDEIHPEILAYRHFGFKLGIMHFTEEYRRVVFSD